MAERIWVESGDFKGAVDEHSCVRCGTGVGWCLTEREYATGEIVERAEFLIYLLSADGRRRWCEDCGMDVDGD